MLPTIKSQRFYLSYPALGEKEVTRQEYIAAERNAGFYPRNGDKESLATGGFGTLNGISGRVKTEYEFSK